MESYLLGDKKDAVCSHHIEGGMGDVHDTSHAEDKGEANGKKSVNTPADEAADDDIQNESHVFSLHRK
jgi:hypothetical protein